jgi:site-specific recombinase XerD
MGRIFSRIGKSGKEIWYVDYFYKGRRHRKKVGPSKQIAKLALSDVELKIARGEWNLGKEEMSLEKFLSEFDSFSKVNHSSSSYVRYKNIVSNFRRFLRERRDVINLDHLMPKLFEDFKVWRRTIPVNKGIVAKSNTVNMELKTIRTLMNYAIKWGYLRENPTSGVSKLKVYDSKMPRFLSKEEVKLFLEKCGEELYPVFFLLLNTGMRLGELKYLTWQDVDTEQKQIKIQTKEYWKPKTGERVIPMSEQVSELILMLKGKKSSECDFIFPGKDNGPMSIKLRERLKTITKKCGFPDVTKVHTLRHTFASHMVMNGVDLPTLQKILGHSDVQTTMIYAHLAQDYLSDAVNKLSY